jgi:purine-binding chemotaxis protein CheW
MGAPQLVVFTLADELYAVDISSIREIIAMQEITPIPRSPRAIEGVINLRGRVVPIVDLRRQLGFPARASSRATRIVVATLGPDTVGLVVDAVAHVLAADPSQIETPSPLVTNVHTDYLKGILKIDGRMIVWLDLSRTLTAGPQALGERRNGDRAPVLDAEATHA